VENRKNKISFIIFILILLIVGVGGYFAMNYFTKNHDKPIFIFGGNTKETDKRIDKKKDYIYYDNESVVISDLDIGFKDIHINLNSGVLVSETLNNESKSNRDSIKYIKDVDIPENETYENNDEGVYSVTYRDYIEYHYDDYISILVEDSTYNVLDSTTPLAIKSYIFDKKQDTLITNEELLKKYNVTLDQIKDKVKTKLTAEQETVDEEPLYDINNTISDFKYALVINKIGKLEINYIVKSTKQNFYDNIVID
jgi:hypothetical protein